MFLFPVSTRDRVVGEHPTNPASSRCDILLRRRYSHTALPGESLKEGGWFLESSMFRTVGASRPNSSHTHRNEPTPSSLFLNQRTAVFR